MPGPDKEETRHQSRASFTMEQSHWLLVSLLLALPACLCLPGKGEKLRINPDDVDRVVQLSNLTRRDPTAKNVNFAWRMTVRSTLATTQDPAHTSTLDAEMSKRNNEIYDKLFAQLAYTLRDKVYLDRWLTEMDKGYHIFLYEIQKQDPKKYFKMFQNQTLFDGPEGTEHFQSTFDFLRSLRNQKNFLKFVRNLHTDKRGVYMGEDFNLVRRPTASEEARHERCPAYDLMLMHLAKAMGDSDIKTRWIDAYLDGFPSFIQHLENKGPAHFLKLDPHDTNFQGCKGGIYWDGITKYINTTGEANMDKFFEQLSKLPSEVNLDDIIKKNMLQL